MNEQPVAPQPAAFLAPSVTQGPLFEGMQFQFPPCPPPAPLKIHTIDPNPSVAPPPRMTTRSRGKAERPAPPSALEEQAPSQNVLPVPLIATPPEVAPIPVPAVPVPAVLRPAGLEAVPAALVPSDGSEAPPPQPLQPVPAAPPPPLPEPPLVAVDVNDVLQPDPPPAPILAVGYEASPEDARLLPAVRPARGRRRAREPSPIAILEDEDEIVLVGCSSQPASAAEPSVTAAAGRRRRWGVRPPRPSASPYSAAEEEDAGAIEVVGEEAGEGEGVGTEKRERRRWRPKDSDRRGEVEVVEGGTGEIQVLDAEESDEEEEGAGAMGAGAGPTLEGLAEDEKDVSDRSAMHS